MRNANIIGGGAQMTYKYMVDFVNMKSFSPKVFIIQLW